MIQAVRPQSALGEAARIAEFVAIFVAGPLALAFFLPPSALFPVLFAVTGVGVLLLSFTPGFRWRELTAGMLAVRRTHVAAISGATAASSAALVFWLVPHQWLFLPRMVPELWLMIIALYPLVSALPQEVLYRVLFFRRYGWLFPDARVAMAANAGLFALAHLMFWNWPAVLLTFAGGWIFAWAYLRGGGFWSAVILHAVAGGILFTSGLGTFFYHGAVPTP
jgi:uncharacterized protein